MAVKPCLIARSHLSDHLDGEPIPFLARAVLRLHLVVCPPCKRAHESLLATRDALRALRDVEPEIDAEEKNRPESV